VDDRNDHFGHRIMSGFALAAQGAREYIDNTQFPVPAARVFAALTQPELIRRWMLGPPGWTLAICKTNPVAGGEFRYLWHNEGGEEQGMSGSYLTVDPPHRLVHVERFDRMPEDSQATITSELTEIEGRTTDAARHCPLRHARGARRDAGNRYGERGPRQLRPARCGPGRQLTQRDGRRPLSGKRRIIGGRVAKRGDISEKQVERIHAELRQLQGQVQVHRLPARSGILEMKLHHEGGAPKWTFGPTGIHNELGWAFYDVGRDPRMRSHPHPWRRQLHGGAPLRRGIRPGGAGGVADRYVRPDLQGGQGPPDQPVRDRGAGDRRDPRQEFRPCRAGDDVGHRPCRYHRRLRDKAHFVFGAVPGDGVHVWWQMVLGPTPAAISC